MDTKELAAKIVDILDSKKGIDIETIDLTGKTVLADYFFLASGNSTTQIKSLADEVEYRLLKYLRGETISVTPEDGLKASGTIIVGIGNYPLGFAKINGQTAKNMYPKAWRLI